MNNTLASQNNVQNTQIRNAAQAQNTGIAKQLYDQNVIANQQYRNSKSAARNNLVESENNLLSNMWKTDALNQMYPQYAVDPTVGGAMNFTKGKTMMVKLRHLLTSLLLNIWEHPIL
jgi:hypothetical protein